MFSATSLVRGQIYLFRGQQLRYLYCSDTGVRSRYMFANSRGTRKELSLNLVQRELQECRNFAEN